MRGGLRAGYNQPRYRAEVADALQTVADLLDALAAGEDNIVAIRKRAYTRDARRAFPKLVPRLGRQRNPFP